MFRHTPALTSIPWSRPLAAKLEQASAAIGRLDARISATSVRPTWQRQAAWTGYARALQLQGHEIDEIDVFSWGTGVAIPGRAKPATLNDPFADFEVWQDQFAANATRHWREDLGALVEPDPSYSGPRLVRALEALRQISVATPTIAAWLTLPLLLQRMGVTTTLLPCLVAGEKRLRLGQGADEAVLRRLLKSLRERANVGLERLVAIERDRARAAQAIKSVSRPAALTRLALRLQTRPIAAPQSLAREFGLTLGGAGKLLARAEDLGLVREVRGTRAWKLYIVPHLAVALGLARALRGRPRREAPTLPHDRDLAEILASFDAGMSSFNQKWGEGEPVPGHDETPPVTS